MNREIKFRGKRTENNKWIYGSLIQKKGYSAIVIFDLNSPYDEYVELEVYPESAGQFTGLFDNNGKEIYESDVYKSHYKWENRAAGRKDKVRIIGKVIFQAPSFKIEGTGKNTGTIAPLISDGEVIGNVFENPDLLNGIVSTSKPAEK